ncbi:MAG TPA: hypothetical protein VEG25_09625 [Burkholderiales bacterium]|nr:hypothetical protein [Burkholderiales bacterium]
MKSSDLRALRVPITTFLVVLLAGGALVYYTKHLTEAAFQQLQQQQFYLGEARVRYQKSGDEKELINHYLRDYLRLQKQGFIGTEPRINWLDGLRIANHEADLYGVGYQIGAQHPYVVPADYNPGNLNLQQSLMKLNFRLLHEEDLMRFFNILATKNVGLFHLDQCSIVRLDNNVAAVRFLANLQAECELTWITLQPADSLRNKQ